MTGALVYVGANAVPAVVAYTLMAGPFERVLLTAFELSAMGG